MKDARRTGKIGAHSNGYVIRRDLTPSLVPLADCKPMGRETRKHTPQQINKLAGCLRRFGFVLPIVLDAGGRAIAGWALVLAARQLGLEKVPAVRVTDLTEAELRLLRLALNRISEDARWDPEELALEFNEILTLEPRIELLDSGFEIPEIDQTLCSDGIDQEDELPVVRATPISRAGDLWHLGDHYLFCGDALSSVSYTSLLGDDSAQMIFADPPYNVPIDGHVSGLGSVKHAEFAMAAGELSAAEFVDFLKTALGHAATHSVNGAIAFVCMDWRHIAEMHAAGVQVYDQLLNLCVWAKSNAGMGSLYRSGHELVFVWKTGKARHINNVALGRFGRNRTNVWSYAGQSALSGTQRSKLSLHPTVKPVAMVADAILDCSNRGGLILDPFGGAGTTLIAAERTGRRARLIELDPTYVDISIERWQRLTGGNAIHAETGQKFGAAGPTRMEKNQ
jgi:DNA modification methylase